MRDDARLIGNPYLRREGARAIDLLLGGERLLSPREDAVLAAFRGGETPGHFLERRKFWQRLFYRKALKRLIDHGFLLCESDQAFYERFPVSSVDLEITAACQAKCPICPRDEMPRDKGHMSEAVFARVVEELRPYRSTIFLSGLGDPLLHPRLCEHLKTLRENRFPVRLVTNGNLLDREMRKNLLEIGVDHVSISFQAFTKETYAVTMGLPFAETLERIKAFTKEAKGKIPVTLCIVESAQNHEEIEAFCAHWRQLGVPVTVTQVHNRAGAITDPAVHPRAIQIQSQPLHRCGLFNTRLFITSGGDILPCCNDTRGEGKLGNILQDPLADLLVQKRERIAQMRLFPMCSRCDDPARHHLITPLHG